MLDCYMGQCAHDAAFWPEISLNSPMSVPGDADPLELIDNVPSLDPNAEEQSIRSELLARLPQFLAWLPPDLRDLAVDHFFMDRSQTDIALSRGVTRSAVCHAVRRIVTLGRTFFGVTVH